MKTILNLIENVDPSDTATLDEIDARVSLWLDGHSFKHSGVDKYENEYIDYLHSNGQDIRLWGSSYARGDMLEYTRSRDALKAIRPEGYSWFCLDHKDTTEDWECRIDFTPQSKPLWEKTWGRLLKKVPNPLVQVFSPTLPTEELAELHAIIQAIQWSRDNENNTRN